MSNLAHRGIAFILAALLQGALAFAGPLDTRLLSLVPSGSQIVGGTTAPIDDHQRGAFLVFARANTLDLEDFFSLVGSDSSRRIDQLVFAASAVRDVGNPEHSLLVFGRFDARGVRESARTTQKLYRGIPMMIVHPFDRERSILPHDRLLAIIDSRLVLFGTPSSVEQEVDRYLDGATIDDSLLEKLRTLRNRDETWCVISSLLFGRQIQRVLRKLDPEFGSIDANTESILFGIHYGRQIEFEYVIHGRHNLEELAVLSEPTGRTMFVAEDDPFAPGFSDAIAEGRDERRSVRMSRAHYEKCLADLKLY